jgi:hypothetical protein
VHIFPSPGKRFMPSEMPSRLLFMGPNIGDGKIIVAILSLERWLVGFPFS